MIQDDRHKAPITVSGMEGVQIIQIMLVPLPNILFYVIIHLGLEELNLTQVKLGFKNVNFSDRKNKNKKK